MSNEKVNIKIFGIDPIDFQEVEFFDFERDEIYYTQSVTFDFEERENDIIISVIFTDFAYLPSDKLKVWTTTKTGFQLWGNDTSFILQPTNGRCLKLCADMTQVSAANNRISMIDATQDKNYGRIITPYNHIEELPKMIKSSLLTSLN